ncbi:MULTISPECIES: hypothetical protein [unclassified Paenibacillus]|uniref:hypothetical protein n=1 Tax=unclassified Paenibacillus TaxID=185978 RepID=UPI0009565834|nr:MULTISPECIES: hypothetical protein [unclassified Paenibacillus]ASS67317.1 hypothetical protein CIC07_15060 [Paenibacillus sp. RUD330]SIQ81582.1 hypothetical protein SAMN05880555_2415 [Paenibacillus sp. RU4X]SIR03046.1 hypothetical protein SAMN05880570_2414 [Paenibacillus sp. RU4T]
MTFVWAAIVVLVVGAILFISIKAGKGWVLAKSESSVRADRLYRLQAYLRDHGIKTKLSEEAGSLRLLVRRGEAEQARRLAEAFDDEGH